MSKTWLDNLLGVVMPLIEGGGGGGDVKNICVDYLSRVEEVGFEHMLLCARRLYTKKNQKITTPPSKARGHSLRKNVGRCFAR